MGRMICLAVLLVGGTDVPSVAQEKKAAPKSAGVLVPIPGYVMAVGDEAQLYCVDGRNRLLRVGVAEDYRAFQMLQRSVYSNDEQGLGELIDVEKTVWLLDSGTRVKVLKKPLFSPPEYPIDEDPEDRGTEIRIMDGPRAGDVAIVPYEYVRKCRWVVPKSKGKRSRR